MLIASAARSPFAPVHGALSGWHPVALGAHVANAARRSAALDPAMIDFVVAGCAMPVGAQGGNVARAIAMAAGWPTNIGAFTVDAGEAASHQALHVGVAMVASGQAHVVVVLGVELASLVPAGASALNRNYGPAWGPAADRFADVGGLIPEGVALDRLAVQHGFTSAILEEHASAARDRGAARANRYVVATAENRNGKDGPTKDRDVVVDELAPLPARLPPLFDDDGTTNAATLAPPADGAAAVVIASDEAMDQLRGLPLGRVGATATTGADPVNMFMALPALVRGLSAHQPPDVVVADTAGAAAELLAVAAAGGVPCNPAGANLGRGRPAGAAGLAAVIEALDVRADTGGAAVIASTTTDGLAVGTRLAVLPGEFSASSTP